MNSRQSYWEAVLRAEGLAPIEFASRGLIESSAEHHKEMTDNARPHWVDAEQLARLAGIIREYRLPVAHRIVLTALVDGHAIRAAARFAGLNKDKAHRIVLRYLRVERVTNAELHNLPLPLSLRPSRATGRARLTSDRVVRDGRRYDLPPGVSESTEAYFALASEYLRVAVWQWLVDRDIWAEHARKLSSIAIAREIGMHFSTVKLSIRRTRRSFFTWLAQRNAALKTKEDV